MKIKKLLIFIFVVAAVFCCAAITAFAAGNNTRVKLEWEIPDINITYNSCKTWDPESLSWVETKEDISVSNQTATFTLTNMSSRTVMASVSFNAAKDFCNTYNSEKSKFENNNCTISQNSSAEITAQLAINEEAFASLNAQSEAAGYGTYIVVISTPAVSIQKTTNNNEEELYNTQCRKYANIVAGKGCAALESSFTKRNAFLAG